MTGNTFSDATVGRRGVGANSFTEGTGEVSAQSTNGYVEVVLYGASEQLSYAIDTPYGSEACADATQLTFGSAYGEAHGSDVAVTEVSVSVSSTAATN